eukprot:73847-Rhodomonas_salina.1
MQRGWVFRYLNGLSLPLHCASRCLSHCSGPRNTSAFQLTASTTGGSDSINGGNAHINGWSGSINGCGVNKNGGT